MSHLLQVFAKYPEPGTVKTRLIPALGAERACDLQRALLTDLLGRVANVVDCELWGNAPADLPHYQHLIHTFSLGYRRQPAGDLGQRMEHALASGLRRGKVPMLIGADCPLMSAGVVLTMIEALDSGVDAVLVPACDGGYVAIGLRVRHHSLFRGIEWGGDIVAEQTLLAMRRSGIRCHVLAPLYDIDTAEDLSRLDELSGSQQHRHVMQWRNGN